MKPGVWCLNAAAALFFAAFAWLFAHDGRWAVAAMEAALVALHVVLGVYNYRRANGRHRQAEADPRDSDPFAGTTTYDATTGAYTYYFSTGSHTGLTKRDAPTGIERVQSDLPILAHRAAFLRFDGTDLHFDSVTSNGRPFGVDADARCSLAYQLSVFGSTYGTSSNHDAPAPECTCGFYALPPDLPATYEHAGTVTLLVELSGTVIEHEKGYRAGHQRVIGCEIPPCPYCGAQAEAVLVSERQMVEAVCANHAPVPAAGQVFVKVEDVAALLPVSVTRAGRVNA